MDYSFMENQFDVVVIFVKADSNRLILQPPTTMHETPKDQKVGPKTNRPSRHGHDQFGTEPVTEPIQWPI